MVMIKWPEDSRQSHSVIWQYC